MDTWINSLLVDPREDNSSSNSTTQPEGWNQISFPNLTTTNQQTTNQQQPLLVDYLTTESQNAHSIDLQQLTQKQRLVFDRLPNQPVVEFTITYPFPTYPVLGQFLLLKVAKNTNTNKAQTYQIELKTQVLFKICIIESKLTARSKSESTTHNSNKQALELITKLRDAKVGRIGNEYIYRLHVDVLFTKPFGEYVSDINFNIQVEISLAQNQQFKYNLFCTANMMPVVLLSNSKNDRHAENLPKIWLAMHANKQGLISCNTVFECMNKYLSHFQHLNIKKTQQEQRIRLRRPLSHTCFYYWLNRIRSQRLQKKSRILDNANYMLADEYSQLWDELRLYQPLLIKLAQPWNDGLIYGFLSPESAESMLRDKDFGTFLVRFGSQYDVPVFSIKLFDRVEHLVIETDDLEECGIHFWLFDEELCMMSMIIQYPTIRILSRAEFKNTYGIFNSGSSFGNGLVATNNRYSNHASASSIKEVTPNMTKRKLKYTKSRIIMEQLELFKQQQSKKRKSTMPTSSGMSTNNSVNLGTLGMNVGAMGLGPTSDWNDYASDSNYLSQLEQLQIMDPLQSETDMLPSETEESYSVEHNTSQHNGSFVDEMFESVDLSSSPHEPSVLHNFLNAPSTPLNIVNIPTNTSPSPHLEKVGSIAKMKSHSTGNLFDVLDNLAKTNASNNNNQTINPFMLTEPKVEPTDFEFPPTTPSMSTDPGLDLDMQPPPLADSKKPCEYCEAAEAKVFCPDCQNYFCEDCGKVIHKAPKKQQHRMQKISPIVKCTYCTIDDAVTMCQACNALCKECDSVLHKNPKFRTHKRTAI